MRESSILSRLEDREAKDIELVEEVIENKELLLHELLNGVSSPNARVRFSLRRF